MAKYPVRERKGSFDKGWSWFVEASQAIRILNNGTCKAEWTFGFRSRPTIIMQLLTPSCPTHLQCSVCGGSTDCFPIPIRMDEVVVYPRGHIRVRRGAA